MGCGIPGSMSFIGLATRYCMRPERDYWICVVECPLEVSSVITLHCKQLLKLGRVLQYVKVYVVALCKT